VQELARVREQVDFHDQVVERDDQPVPAHRDLDRIDVEVECMFGEYFHVVLHVAFGNVQLAFSLDLVCTADALNHVHTPLRVFEFFEHRFLVVDHNHFRVYKNVDHEFSAHVIR